MSAGGAQTPARRCSAPRLLLCDVYHHSCLYATPDLPCMRSLAV